MLALAAELRHRGCELVSISEAIDTSSQRGNAVLAVMAALAQLEVDLRAERAREAHRARKAAGKPWGRRPAFRDSERVRAAQELLADPAIPRADIARPRRGGAARSCPMRARLSCGT